MEQKANPHAIRVGKTEGNIKSLGLNLRTFETDSADGLASTFPLDSDPKLLPSHSGPPSVESFNNRTKLDTIVYYRPSGLLLSSLRLPSCASRLIIVLRTLHDNIMIGLHALLYRDIYGRVLLARIQRDSSHATEYLLSHLFYRNPTSVHDQHPCMQH